MYTFINNKNLYHYIYSNTNFEFVQHAFSCRSLYRNRFFFRGNSASLFQLYYQSLISCDIYDFWTANSGNNAKAASERMQHRLDKESRQ